MTLGRIATRSLAAIQGCWLLAGATLVCLLIVEGLAAATLRLLGPDERDLPALPDRSGAPLVWPAGNLESAWTAFVYWRARPLSSEIANIDERGLRRTWNPSGNSGPPTRLFVFGGSTAWGPGARDEFTIPSRLSRSLADVPGVQVEVTNFGQGAYVSTQELLTLVLELQRGNVPDVVVFYDGINDTFSTYQNGRAGVPQNEAWRRLDFESAKAALLYRIARRSSSIQLFRRFAGASFAETWAPPEPREASSLARETVDAYAGNIGVVEALAARYGFLAFYYWQPVVWTKRHPSPYEQTTVELVQRSYPSLDEFYREVYGIVRSDPALAANPRFRNLSDAFDGIDDSVFWDWMHVTEDGNERVAAEMSRDVGAALAARNGSARGTLRSG